MDKTYDVTVIGAGPAGITAAIYAARKQMNVLLLSETIGGQAAIALNVEDYGGYQFIPADNFIEKLNHHKSQYHLTVKSPVTVDTILQETDGFTVQSGKHSFFAKGIILATGRDHEKLDVPGEKKFLGKGISYCATCDAPLFSDKIVVVVGNNNHALYAVIQLMSIAQKVYLITSDDDINGNRSLVQKVRDSKKVIIFPNTTVEEIFGNNVISKIKIKKKDSSSDTVQLNGLFILVGYKPIIPLIKKNKNALKKNKKDEIIVDENCSTNIPGLFAAGDVTNIPQKQVLTAAGQGCIASLSLFKYINLSRLHFLITSPLVS